MHPGKWLKYLPAFLAPLGVLAGILVGGWTSCIPLVFAFVLVPFAELLLKPDNENVSDSTAEDLSKNPLFSGLLYLLLPLQYSILFLFLKGVGEEFEYGIFLLGKVLSVGLTCGIIGINVGHELGHRPGKFDRVFAKLFLLSSLYMHFFIEHNQGHHKRVGTHDDPASARYGESLYLFWCRTVPESYCSAWRLENARLKKLNLNRLSLNNQMIQFHIIELGLLAAITGYFGLKATGLFLLTSFLGILLLETVNYIEHYGIGRRLRNDGTYSKTLPCHSWNSNHRLGRILLFELPRHSDHHYKASKKYQVLNHHVDSPQMPTGYPGMILLALFPPLWFKVMHPRIAKELARFQEMVVAG